MTPTTLYHYIHFLPECFCSAKRQLPLQKYIKQKIISCLRCNMSQPLLSVSCSLSSHCMKKKVNKYFNNRNPCGSTKYPQVMLRQKISFLYKHTHTNTHKTNPFPHIPCVLSPMSVSVICFIYMLYDLIFYVSKKHLFFIFRFNLFFIIFLKKKEKTETT